MVKLLSCGYPPKLMHARAFRSPCVLDIAAHPMPFHDLSDGGCQGCGNPIDLLMNTDRRCSFSGQGRLKFAPTGVFGATPNCPPRPSATERQIESAVSPCRRGNAVADEQFRHESGHECDSLWRLDCREWPSAGKGGARRARPRAHPTLTGVWRDIRWDLRFVAQPLRRHRAYAFRHWMAGPSP
jgi:hypothetical protein